MQRYFSQRLFFFFVLLLLLGNILMAGFFLIGQTAWAEQQISATLILQRINSTRREHGLALLTVDARLTQAAYNRAQDMLSKGYFAHAAPDGKNFADFIKEVNYTYFFAGENLAVNYFDADKAVEAWLASPTHAANILNTNYKETGIAVVPGKFNKQQTIIIVQLFGTQTTAGTSRLNPQAISSPLNDPANYFFLNSFLQVLAKQLMYLAGAAFLLIILLEIKFYLRQVLRL